MKRNFLIVGLIVATGVLFKTLVVANTVDQNTTYPMEDTTIEGTAKVKLDASMVGIFSIGDELFFRDVYGNIGKASETNKERRMFSRSALPSAYEIVWENGMKTNYSVGVFNLRQNTGEVEPAHSMPDFIEEKAVKEINN